MRAKDTISIEYLKTRLRYDPDTGDLIWLSGPHTRWNKRYAGRKAGCGYGLYWGIRVVAVSKTFYAHRLIWALQTGSFPTGDVDHINGNKRDNRWSNLRHATRAQNIQNTPILSNNTSGYKGVRLTTQRFRPWVADISANGKAYYLGSYATLEEALEVRKAAEAKYHGAYAWQENG